MHEEQLDPLVEQQIKKICHQGLFRKTRIQLLMLRGLLMKDAAECFDNAVSGGTIAKDIYDRIYAAHPEWKRRDEDTAGAAKHLVEKLRARLNGYYAEHPNDPVIITIPKGTYQPTIEFRQNANDVSGHTGGNLHPVLSGNSYFKHIGTSKEALKSLIERIPHARLIEDTAIRSDDGSLYGDMEEGYIAALRDSGVKYTSITGPVQDDAYVKALKLAYRKRPNDLTCFRLHHATPMLNFVLIYEHDEETPTEAFFGYGTEQHGQPDAVFRSNDTHLVKEFRRLFWILRDAQFSRLISVDDPEFLWSIEQKCDVLATFLQFPEPEIKKRIADCHKKIVICTTAWSAFDSCKFALKQALKNGCQIEMALWKESSRFFKLRGKELNAQGDVNDELTSTLKQNHQLMLNEFDVGPNSNFKYHQCSGQGSVTIFWIDDVIYFSPYWSGVRASEGPHFMVRADSKTGKHLREQYQQMLSA